MRFLRFIVFAWAIAFGVCAAALGLDQVLGGWNRWNHARRDGGAVQDRPARTFHVAATGSDTADARSPATAWRSLARVNAEALVPGDTVLLQGGTTFAGPLVLDERDVGAAARPIVITSHGDSAATIDGGDGTGIEIVNTAGIALDRLHVVGRSHAALDHAALAAEKYLDALRTNLAVPSGIDVHNGLHGNVQLRGIRLSRLVVSGFSGHGVAVRGTWWFSGFRDVRIEDVHAHHNGLSGITVEGHLNPITALLADRVAARYAHATVRIRRALAHDNTGLAGVERPHTGSGIVVSGVQGALVEDSEAYANGGRSTSAAGGPVGIWAYEADRVVIQRNRSHHNRSGGTKDGGGFDLDGGTTRSLVRDNDSWNNDGAGYLVFHYRYAHPSGGNVLRGNTSRDDGRRNHYGAVHVIGAVHDVEVRDNRIVMDTAPRAAHPAAIIVQASADEAFGPAAVTRRVRVLGNTVTVARGVPAVEVDSGHVALRFDSNTYVGVASDVAVRWGARAFTSVAAWRAATGQEPAGLPVLRFDRAGAPASPPTPRARR